MIYLCLYKDANSTSLTSTLLCQMEKCVYLGIGKMGNLYRLDQMGVVLYIVYNKKQVDMDTDILKMIPNTKII